MRLYHSPGSCSEGIHFLLDVIGATYDLEIVDLKKGAHKTPEFLTLNPKGKVPALQIADGKLLTEFPVIAYWIARNFPEENLLPDDLYEQVKVMELTEHIASGLHMRGVSIPARLALRSSRTTLSGMSFWLIAGLKNSLAATLSQHLDSMKSRVLPCLSMER